ncbi:NADPH:quinone oxidoreductase family protein [Xanthobacter autotrophicus DSM 431]|uniref:NADPH:quinone oxidoreductase family protein n=1 Tax=Xanthobacter nonsaccharivorans TaxID=3119912 RepID=UPI00372700FE
MTIDALPDLSPGSGEVAVDVVAAGVGFVDTLVVSGRYQNIPACPFTPGMEFAGRVRAVGADVSGVRVGDRVAAYVLNGAFAEQAVAPVGSFYPVPEDVPLDQAALLCGAYLTAHFALVARGRLQPGEAVLIGGAGGAVGLAAVQIAKALGARVLAGVRSAADRDAVIEAGADAVIDLSGSSLHDAVRAQVSAATDGRGADVVIDPIGGDFLPAALRATAWCGRLVVIGFAAGEIPTVKVNYLLLKNISIVGLDLSQYRSRTPDLLGRVQGELFDLWRRGFLKPRIAHHFSFEQVPDAVKFVANGRSSGRAIIHIGSEAA